MAKESMPTSLLEMDPWDSETRYWNAIIETPAGSRNKYKYDVHSGLFTLNKVLPEGFVFPHDFGFLPATLGEDGDPLDILVFLEQPVYPGIRVPVRLIGALQVKQTQEGKTLRNDRFVGVAEGCQAYADIQQLKELDATLIAQLEHFFVSYGEMEKRLVKPEGLLDAQQARKRIEAGQERFKKHPSGS